MSTEIQRQVKTDQGFGYKYRYTEAALIGWVSLSHLTHASSHTHIYTHTHTHTQAGSKNEHIHDINLGSATEAGRPGLVRQCSALGRRGIALVRS